MVVLSLSGVLLGHWLGCEAWLVLRIAGLGVGDIDGARWVVLVGGVRRRHRVLRGGREGGRVRVSLLAARCRLKECIQVNVHRIS